MGAAAASQPTVIRMVNPSTGAVFDFCGRWLRQSPATERDVRMGRAKFRGDRVYLDLPPGVQAQVDKGVLQLAGPEDEGAARHPADDLSDVLELPGLEDIPMPTGAGATRDVARLRRREGHGSRDRSRAIA